MKHLLGNVVDLLCWVLALPALVFVGYRSYVQSDDRRSLVIKWIISAPLIVILDLIIRIPNPYAPILLLFPAITLGFIWAPSLGSILVAPLTSAFDGGEEETEAKPFYFTAEGKRRKGLYEEAIAEVRKQLEKFPGDHEGYLKLAAIQMENLKDLPAAEATLNEFLEQPDHAPNEIAGVLHLLADWQLQFGHNAKAAMASLQRIVELYPGSPFDHAAKQRIAHLGSADETNRVRHESKFAVPPRERDVGLRKESAPAAAATDPDALAAEYVKQLELHPSDTETREKIAVLYAEQFQRMDLAVNQLEQLIALPEEPPRHVARWLNLLATLQVKHSRNVAAAQNALQRIVEKFPGSALATVAAMRIASLPSELAALQKSPLKTMGAYEKNLGLQQAP
jgi:outer membrane protein assembly factor BamD (BamD/ComL family)